MPSDASLVLPQQIVEISQYSHTLCLVITGELSRHSQSKILLNLYHHLHYHHHHHQHHHIRSLARVCAPVGEVIRYKITLNSFMQQVTCSLFI